MGLVDDRPRLMILSRNGLPALEKEAELAAARARFRVTMLRQLPDAGGHTGHAW